MATTIFVNDGTGDNTIPVLVTGYEADADTRNLVHDLIGGGIAVSLIAPRPRSGVLELLYADRAAAWSAYALHTRETSFTLTDDDVPEVDMSYVLDDSGQLAIILDDETRSVWLLQVPFCEVTP